ncbi:MAG: 50S ribosomal protein L25 [Verrucomicrobiota bacterium]
MAKQVKLSARPRAETGRNALIKVRARGAVPAVFYGAKDASSNLEVLKKDIDRLLSHAVSENILVELEITDGGTITNRLSLIQEVQRHAVRDQVIHVDFHAVSMTEEIEAEVVLEPVGESIGVKSMGGLLQQNMRSLGIRCLPQNLPEMIMVDVSALSVGDSLHVRDIKLPEGVFATPDAELTVFLVSEPSVAEVPAASVATAASPEVIKEKKTEAADAKKPAEAKK